MTAPIVLAIQCRKCVKLALSVYEKEEQEARAERDRVYAAASAEFDRVIAPARAERDRVYAAASAERDLRCSSAYKVLFSTPCVCAGGAS